MITWWECDLMKSTSVTFALTSQSFVIILLIFSLNLSTRVAIANGGLHFFCSKRSEYQWSSCLWFVMIFGRSDAKTGVVMKLLFPHNLCNIILLLRVLLLPLLILIAMAFCKIFKWIGISTKIWVVFANCTHGYSFLDHLSFRT